MSRTTMNINRIKESLDSISGLDGAVGYFVEKKADEIEKYVGNVLKKLNEAEEANEDCFMFTIWDNDTHDDLLNSESKDIK